MPASRCPSARQRKSEPARPTAFAGPILEGEEVRRQTQRRVVCALVRVSFFCFPLFVCPLQLSAATHPNTIICREELSAARRELLAAKLRAITGLAVEFDANRALRLAHSDRKSVV